MTKRRCLSLLSRLANRDGAAAVEFAILAPVLLLVLAGAIDFGGVVFVKFRLDNAVSSASVFAINSRANVDEDNSPALASQMVAILASGGATGGTVIINNGLTASIPSGATSGTAANANLCYCPTRPSSTVVWGGAVACGSACAGGGRAGRFVTIEASQTYTPLFSNYGFFDENQQISIRAVVQTE